VDGDQDGDALCDIGAHEFNDFCPEDDDKTEAGICGCGVADTDTDGDGTPDCNDSCAEDSNKLEAGICGCGTPDVDANGDGFIDCTGSSNPPVTEETKPTQAPMADTPIKKGKLFRLLLQFEPLGKVDSDAFGSGRFKAFYQVEWTRTRGGKTITRKATTKKPKYLIRDLKEGDVVTFKYRVLVRKRKKNKKTGRVKFKTIYTSEYGPEGMVTIG
jgi:hypothetical protein